MQHQLLFEIGTEEIPAGFIMPALESMQSIIADRLTDLGLPFGAVTGAATPRRLAVCVDGLAERQPDRREEVFGPPKQAAFDAKGQPTKAAIGFAKSKGGTVADLQVVETAKGEYVMLVQEHKGEATAQLLADLLPAVVQAIPFAKSMRWGSGRTSFARPIRWLLALYNGKVVDCRLETLTAGETSRGHRFMAPASFPVSDFANYLDSLRRAHVIADPDERRRAAEEEVTRAAASVGATVIPDPELLETVTHLVEEPHAVCGTFEERFLELPREVLITSMREHQKYFAVVNEAGELMPHFVALNNTRVRDERLAAEGHQRVLRARLEDAFFFFNEDRRRPLADRVEELAGVIFQAKLGTMRDKTERITRLAAILAERLAPDQRQTAERAARLAKADLLTDMVGEFPSLQGVIGADYAHLGGETDEVATAIVEHYMPVRAGSALPTTVAGALVGLADRLDTLAGCFGIGQIPSGTADPFGLRRQALGLLHIIADQGFALSLAALIDEALALYGDRLSEAPAVARANLIEFLKGRFTHDLVARGIQAEAVEAVTSVAFDDPVDCRRRIDALVAISSQESFTVLAGAFKRVINIIKDHRDRDVDPSLLAEPAEKGLYEAYRTVAAEVEPLLAARAYEEALAVILRMKEPVDRFFDEVMVMTDDEALRRNRLALLAAIAALFLKIGDFSKMYTLQA